MTKHDIRFASSPTNIVRVPNAAVFASQADSLEATTDPAALNAKAVLGSGVNEHRLPDEQLSILLADIQRSIEELHSQRRSSLEEMQRVAVELSIAVASRLVHEKISADDYSVEDTIGRVIDKMNPDGPLQVSLHPSDFALLKERTEKTTPSWQELHAVKFATDPSLQRGSCRVSAGDACVLSEIESQLSEIRCHVLEALDHAQNERRKAQETDSSLRRFSDRRDTA